MSATKVGIRVSPEQLALIDALGNTVSAAGLAYVLEAWSALHALTLRDLRERRVLDAREASLVLEALNGVGLTLDGHAELAGQMLAAEVGDAIALNALHKKHGVDAEHLLATLRGLSLWERHVVEVWAALAWARHDDEVAWERAIRSLAAAAAEK